ncbi:ribosomal subunit interface protein [Sulfurifustis variabilis]|uniref:RNA 3'-terminal phosphate cyclase n=1 Tax=Sulfurifustis variabilis TaxID=1675686 RepID=A0A1B4VCT0_9GAMM|nr:RNA 3'-terminal phosphate cyclase [Sulfurifustis variabilis]BAU46807.1 ribosomal subunit interface protein [Sulfurifustis variabilis]
MKTIDASHGEGGGQVVRTACALAAMTGEGVRLVNMRAGRRPPGLAAQHLTAVRAVAALCDAEVAGLALGAREIVFLPGRIKPGEFRFDVGTAGSVTLVLQALLPAALCAPGPVRVTVTGGTDVRATPTVDYFQRVFLPLLARTGARASLRIVRRGYYPRGGGEVELTIEPCGRFAPLRLEQAGALELIEGFAYCANLPGHIAARMANAATARLAGLRVRIDTRVLGRTEAFGPGGAIVLAARTAHALLGALAVAERGVPAERLGELAADELRPEIESGATLDVHAADQLLVYLARAAGPSVFLARTLSLHVQTVCWLLEQFLPVRFRSSAQGALSRLEVMPA